MNRIQYYYSAMSRQVFLILLMLLILARLTIFLEVIVFDINNYTASFNIVASILLYAIQLGICLFFFFGHKYFYSEYNETEIVYYNRLLRKKQEIKIARAASALLGKRGITLYDTNQEPLFYLPFFRLGIISPVGVDGFYKILKAENISIEKQFTTLPGHGASKKVLSIFYSCLALFTLASLTQAIALARAIFQSQM